MKSLRNYFFPILLSGVFACSSIGKQNPYGSIKIIPFNEFEIIDDNLDGVPDVAIYRRDEKYSLMLKVSDYGTLSRLYPIPDEFIDVPQEFMDEIFEYKKFEFWKEYQLFLAEKDLKELKSGIKEIKE